MNNLPVLRAAVSFVLAVLIGVSLFYGMVLLVTTGIQGVNKTDSLGGVEFVRLKHEDKIETKKRIKKKPPKPKDPPPPPKLEVQEAEKPQTQALQMDIPKMDLPLRMGGGPFMGGLGQADSKKDGGLIPLVTIAPMYPRKALMKRQEGYVIVEFTVTRDGTVKNPKILEAKPRSVFNQAALRTILRYKFKPVIVDGQPQESQASWKIVFEIED
jgi:protein TonB